MCPTPFSFGSYVGLSRFGPLARLTGFFIASFQAVAKDGPILQSRSIVFGDR